MSSLEQSQNNSFYQSLEQVEYIAHNNFIIKPPNVKCLKEQ